MKAATFTDLDNNRKRNTTSHLVILNFNSIFVLLIQFLFNETFIYICIDKLAINE